MKKLTNKAFTLVELLIVIGIIGLLAVTVLLALNPGEAQKKSRDAKRIKDTTTLQAAIEQYLDSGSTIPSSAPVAGSTGVDSSALTTDTQRAQCNGGWISGGTGSTSTTPLNFCAYVKNLPLDPSNGQTRDVVTASGTTGSGTTIYRVRIVSGQYEIDVRQESKDNSSKVVSDGGNSTQWFEVGSDLTLLGN